MHGCKTPPDRSCASKCININFVSFFFFFFFEDGEKEKRNLPLCNANSWSTIRRALFERMHSTLGNRETTHVRRILTMPSLRVNSATRLLPLAFKSIPASFVTTLKKRKRHHKKDCRNVVLPNGGMRLNAREKLYSRATRNFNLYGNKTSRVRTRLFLDSWM